MNGLQFTEESDRIARLTLNRPDSLNALDGELLEAIDHRIRAASGEYLLLIVDGNGRAFTAGADLEEAGDGENEEAIERFQNITRAVQAFDGLVIGALHGWVVGGGLEWTLSFDLRYAAENARFKFPESTIGIPISNGSSWLLPQTVGTARAQELVYTSREVDATEAAEIGLVTEVVPEDELDERVIAVATDLAESQSERGLRLNKRAITRSMQLELALQNEELVGAIATAKLEEVSW